MALGGAGGRFELGGGFEGGGGNGAVAFAGGSRGALTSVSSASETSEVCSSAGSDSEGSVGSASSELGALAHANSPSISKDLATIRCLVHHGEGWLIEDLANALTDDAARCRAASVGYEEATRTPRRSFDSGA